MRYVLVLVGALLVALVGLSFLGVGPFQGDWSEPTPEITSLEITDRGCYDEVRGFAMSSTGGVYAGVINDTSPETELSAEIRRTSPERADVTTYHLDMWTHEPETANEPCPGAIAYRVEYDAPYDETASGLRQLQSIDGELRSCGGSTSGPDLGCVEPMDDTDTHWTNRSTVESG